MTPHLRSPSWVWTGPRPAAVSRSSVRSEMLACSQTCFLERTCSTWRLPLRYVAYWKTGFSDVFSFPSENNFQRRRVGRGVGGNCRSGRVLPSRLLRINCATQRTSGQLSPMLSLIVFAAGWLLMNGSCLKRRRAAFRTGCTQSFSVFRSDPAWAAMSLRSCRAILAISSGSSLAIRINSWKANVIRNAAAALGDSVTSSKDETKSASALFASNRSSSSRSERARIRNTQCIASARTMRPSFPATSSVSRQCG